MAPRNLTPQESDLAQRLLANARNAMTAIADYDQARVDRICQAIAWAAANPESAERLANMSVDESGMGSREPRRRAKVLGILRDALRQKSTGVIEEIPDKGIVKYAKPAGVICSLIPVTSPYITPIGIAIYAIKCKDAVIFSPHPSSKKTTNETVRLMRAALDELGIPQNVLQCVEQPSIPLADELMSICDLTIANRHQLVGQGNTRLLNALQDVLGNAELVERGAHQAHGLVGRLLARRMRREDHRVLALDRVNRDADRRDVG